MKSKSGKERWRSFIMPVCASHLPSAQYAARGRSRLDCRRSYGAEGVGPNHRDSRGQIRTRKARQGHPADGDAVGADGLLKARRWGRIAIGHSLAYSPVCWVFSDQQYEKKLTDYNFGTMVRKDADRMYDHDNCILVTRVQFFAIEVSLNSSQFSVLMVGRRDLVPWLFQAS